jgi:hypothetical protein
LSIFAGFWQKVDTKLDKAASPKTSATFFGFKRVRFVSILPLGAPLFLIAAMPVWGDATGRPCLGPAF